ncbi:hypothetical protein ABL78_1658 [Leptomonas seymouri]|uniref:Uncharacterized protein n=1 Tax=Leptomonas seymouri TaxID=5684 RepID=A0A0N1PEN1_LEPSE|nr:hypothetical protein ABL78_1658 [Leptomonas seymouri]|eukprot:KPI89235.1 hypothetical protein ABL78_1658 [Leptomonas seymouri]
MASSSESFILHCISGKSVTLPFPTTFKGVFEAAVAPPFSFVPESIKIPTRGGVINVLRYLKQHPNDKDGGFIDASAYTVADTAISTGLRTPESRSLSPSSSAARSASGGRRGSFKRSLIVFGVPRRVKAWLNGTPAEGPPKASSSAAVSPASCAHICASASATAKEFTAPASALHTSSPHGTSTAVVPARPFKGRPSAKRNQMRDPLPYPHSPDGLLELAKAVSDPDPSADDDDDLISFLQGAPQRVYNHPTMSYISHKVKGNLVTLRAVMEHIYRVAPVFYAWIEAHPQKFLSALNRVGERSLQQVKDQLHLLALQAAAGQISGEGPSRRVMMLEVNTRDGTPDVYRVEVQVGDFSDDDDDDDSTSASESLYYVSVEQSDEQDYEEQEGEEDEVVDEHECDASSMESITDLGDSKEDEAGDEGVAWDHKSAKVAADGADGERDEGQLLAEEHVEGDGEPHRGAVLLSPVERADAAPKQTPNDAVPSDHDDGAAAAIATTSSPSSAPQNASADTTPLFPASVPVRTWRTSTSLSPTSCSAATQPPASPLVVNALPELTAAGAAPTAVGDVPAAPREDARLAQLREGAHAVDLLRREYTRQGDDLAAQRTHHTITLLRPEFFATVGEVCNAISSSASAEEAERQGALLRRVVRCACDFFVTAEEFYAQLEEEGVRASVFGPSPQESLAAWAAVAALSRLLMCDVDMAGQEAVAGIAAAAVAGPRRIGALRSLHTVNSLWSNPAVHWALTRSPEQLLASILQLCRQQRAVMLWYSSHYLMKTVGKTIQTMAYVFGGTEEAQQPVTLQRLKMTSKAHKSDEVADCLAGLFAVTASSPNTGNCGDQGGSAVPSSWRRNWVSLMYARYQQLVRPIECDLPTPHMTANTLYVCDTRHVLTPKENMDGRNRSTMESAARWWAAYCDDRNTMCMDKWCLAVTMRPWNAALASESAEHPGAVERTAVHLVSQTGNLKTGEVTTAFLQGILPTEKVVTGAASTSSPFATTARHTAVLQEQAVAQSAALSADTQLDNLNKSSTHGLSPHFIGDIHIVDVTSRMEADPSLAVNTRLAGGAEVHTHLATIVRNYLLPSAARRSVFLPQLSDVFARHPQIPAAAAARQAALANASAHGAPWLVCEYILLDYGGTIRSIASSASAASPVDCVTRDSPEDPAVANGDFVRMPAVRLSNRLSEPRPVSTVNRKRISSLPNDEGRGVSRSAVNATTSAAEDAVKRQYARTHAIDELYEIMLGSLLEHKPTGERNVLNHLVNYLETSEETMQEKVQRRQAETAGAAVAMPVEATRGNTRTGGGPSPKPPSTKRNAKGRPSFPRQKPSP